MLHDINVQQAYTETRLAWVIALHSPSAGMDPGMYSKQCREPRQCSSVFNFRLSKCILISVFVKTSQNIRLTLIQIKIPPKIQRQVKDFNKKPTLKHNY